MAFGDKLGTAGNSNSSPGTGLTATASITVAVGDLIVVGIGFAANSTTISALSPGVTVDDNLGNTYTPP